MTKRKALPPLEEPGEPMPDADQVLWIMLNTPPQPHTGATPKPKARKTKKPVK